MESRTPKQIPSTKDLTIGTNDRQENLLREIDNLFPSIEAGRKNRDRTSAGNEFQPPLACISR
jgi:hypothetical protein